MFKRLILVLLILIPILTACPPPESLTANAGPDQKVEIGALVQLDGSGSRAPEGEPLIYAWAFVSVPDGSVAELDSDNSVNPTFTADLEGKYVVKLTINSLKSDEVTITAGSDTPPPNEVVANAGTDKMVDIGETVTLDGTASAVPQGETPKYTWSFTAIPEGSSATLANDDTATPSFTADLEGSYTVRLVVEAPSGTDEESVTIKASKEQACRLEVSGSINEETTWRNVADCDTDILVTGNVNLGKPLTIEAGTRIVVSTGVSISTAGGISSSTRQGSITALGTKEAPIVFTGEQEVKGFWNGLRFIRNTSTLRHVEVAYATDNLYQDGGELTVENSLSRDASGAGINVDSGAVSLTLSSNTFKNNDEVGIKVHPNSLGFMSPGQVFEGNGSNFVEIYISSSLTRAQTLPAQVPFRVGGTGLNLGKPLTIEAGARIVVGTGAAISTSGGVSSSTRLGSITAIGTEEAPIIFTGEQEVKGFWKGLRLFRNTSTLKHVEIAFATDNIYIDGGGLALENSLLREASGAGLNVDAGTASLAMTENTFRANQGAGVTVHPNSMSFVSAGQTYEANGSNLVEIYESSSLTRAQTLPANVPFRISGNGLNLGKPLTIEAGARVVMGQGTRLSTGGGVSSSTRQGSVTAVGTAEAPIVFVGEQEVKGYWTGFTFIRNTNTLKFVEVAYGTNNILLDGGSVIVDVTSSTLRDASECGLKVDTGSVSPSTEAELLNQNTFTNNGPDGAQHVCLPSP